MSVNLARDCCLEFDRTIKSLYQAEYLRLPTADDLRAIEKLHKSKHRVNGMYGSLDCMHTHWKNCPKAWQGQFQGKEKKPTIVLEAICDYHMWFWHASYGYAGTLNDLNVLNLSPFLDALLDGRFATLERDSGVVPYKIFDGDEGDEFNEMYILVDGIYHQFSRFVKAHREPISREEKRFTGWQESARKDIERAFGVLQLKFQWIARPINLYELKDISKRVATCLILHNMCVSDRIMGDVRATYNPAHGVAEVDISVEMPDDLAERQANVGGAATASSIGVRNLPPEAVILSTRN
jgi:hypothetical protein